jgi:hypothetical protein
MEAPPPSPPSLLLLLLLLVSSPSTSLALLTPQGVNYEGSFSFPHSVSFYGLRSSSFLLCFGLGNQSRSSPVLCCFLDENEIKSQVCLVVSSSLFLVFYVVHWRVLIPVIPIIWQCKL